MPGLFDEAYEALSSARYERAIELVLVPAESGDPEAQEILGMAYWLGLGRFEEAEHWLKLASDAGRAGASHNLGVMYQGGWPGRPADLEQFRHYLQKAYDAGFEHTVASDPLWWKSWRKDE